MVMLTHQPTAWQTYHLTE